MSLCINSLFLFYFIYPPTLTGWTPLMEACSNGDSPSAILLIEAGADQYPQESSKGKTALILAAESGMLDVVDRLLSNFDAARAGIFVATPLWYAAFAGRSHLIRALAMHSPEWINQPHAEYRSSPLSIACQHGHEDVAKLLLCLGANPQSTDNRNNSPIQYAASKCTVSLLYMLVVAGASISSTPESIDTFPLAEVIKSMIGKHNDKSFLSDRIEAVELLLILEADVKQVVPPVPKARFYSSLDEAREGETAPIYLAALTLCPQIISLLLAKQPSYPHALIEQVLNKLRSASTQWKDLSEQHRLCFTLMKQGLHPELVNYIRYRFREVTSALNEVSRGFHAIKTARIIIPSPSLNELSSHRSSVDVAEDSSSSSVQYDQDEWFTIPWQRYFPDAFNLDHDLWLTPVCAAQPIDYSGERIVPVGFKRDPQGGWYHDPEYDWGDEEDRIKRVATHMQFQQHHYGGLSSNHGDGAALMYVILQSRRIKRNLMGERLKPLPYQWYYDEHPQ